MNSGPNSDSKQCTELSVQCALPKDPGCAHAAHNAVIVPSSDRVVARTGRVAGRVARYTARRVAAPRS